MIYRDLTKIEYPILHDAIFILLCRGYKLDNVYLDPNGEVCLTFNDILKEDAIKDVFVQLAPTDVSYDDIELQYDVQYSYSDDNRRTYVYSQEGINYKKL